METSFVPRIYDPTVADSELAVGTEEAHAMCRRLAAEEGLLMGISAAAARVGALQVARSAAPDSVVVTIFPDSGDTYLSEQFLEDSATT
jgi:cysteine synthase